MPLSASLIVTPIGHMISISDSDRLYLLKFCEGKNLATEIENLQIRYKAVIIRQNNTLNQELVEQLNFYFTRKLKKFTIPMRLYGSEFQQKVWRLLSTIPYGGMATYKQLATLLGDEKKVRAVGNANARNQISILIPCHRVIKSNGELGGYAGGIARKKYLLNLEQ